MPSHKSLWHTSFQRLMPLLYNIITHIASYVTNISKCKTAKLSCLSLFPMPFPWQPVSSPRKKKNIEDIFRLACSNINYLIRHIAYFNDYQCQHHPEIIVAIHKNESVSTGSPVCPG